MMGFGDDISVGTQCNMSEGGSYCAKEHWLTMFALSLGLIFQSLVISEISSVLVELSMLKQKHREEMRVVNHYMASDACRFVSCLPSRWRHVDSGPPVKMCTPPPLQAKKKLPPELRDKITNFYERSYKENSGVDEGAILDKARWRSSWRRGAARRRVARVLAIFLSRDDVSHVTCYGGVRRRSSWGRAARVLVVMIARRRRLRVAWEGGARRGVAASSRVARSPRRASLSGSTARRASSRRRRPRVVERRRDRRIPTTR